MYSSKDVLGIFSNENPMVGKERIFLFRSVMFMWRYKKYIGWAEHKFASGYLKCF